MKPTALKFGTDGVRDKAGQGALAPESVERLGRALGDFLHRDGSTAGCVILGGDTRRSREEIAAALGEGLGRRGFTTIDLGVLPTTALGVLAEDYGAVASAVISASHNPADDNGIKIFGGHGEKLGDPEATWIEERWHELDSETPSGAAVPLQHDDGGAERYLERLLAAVGPLNLGGKRVALDMAHGAAYQVGPAIWRRLGAELVTLNDAPNGSNINQDCGSLHTEGLSRQVVETGAWFGFAVDGDADRCILVDAEGQEIDGDGVLAMIAADLLDRDRLPERTVVGTIMSNFGLETFLTRRDVRLERTPVGDRHISRRLREAGMALGGEPSGHVIFGPDLAFLGDGLYTALRVAEVLHRRGQGLRESLGDLVLVPQVQKRVRVVNRPALDEISGFREKRSAAEETLAGRGRVVVRYSGTEPVLRVMVEGDTAVEVESIAQGLADHLAGEIGEA